MCSSSRSGSVWFWFAVAWFSLALSGCGSRARQDRAISWSAEGQAVGFQHQEAGVFIADKDGGQLEKIFQPGPDVLVTGTPLWSPTDRRLLFTTARDPNRQPAPQPLQSPFGLNPDGEVYHQRPVAYTCWIRAEPKAGQAVQPQALFEAACDHPGYIAANLAVRWHPQGDRIYYLHQIGVHEHALFEYDLRTKRARRIFPKTAEALIFDWTSDGSHLVCVLGNTRANLQESGTWIGKPGADDWWHVPHSEELGEGQLPSLLEQVRAAQPAWTRDGTRFAFTSHTPGTTQEDPGRSSLWLGTMANRQVERWADGTEPLRQLHWDPAGSRLGLVRGRANPSLHLIQRPGEWSASISRKPVRRFAGWNATGDRLAYIVAEPMPAATSQNWAFLLVPDAQPRDAVYIAAGTGQEPGREVFSGMRVTFPHWSPLEDKLSVWFTFIPTHRSLLSRLLGWGLPRGDPAAVLEASTGQIGWMAVHAYEKAQIGHYHLLKGAYAEAWRWYQEAEVALPAPQPLPAEQSLVQLLMRRDFTFFEYYCLARLGREAEARAKLEQFRQRVVLEGRGPGQEPRVPSEAEIFQTGLVKDFYMAEVFLSLDAAAEGREFFRKQLAAAQTDSARLSSAIVLGQLFLLEKHHADYADLATDTLRPLLFKLGKPGLALSLYTANITDPQGLLALVGDLALLPLYDPQFLATLPHDQLLALLPRWLALRDQAREDQARLTADLFLEAACQQLGRKEEQQAVAVRIQSNPARGQYLPKGVAGLIEEVRQFPVQMDALRELFSGL
jgi:hypothetical protein